MTVIRSTLMWLLQWLLQWLLYCTLVPVFIISGLLSRRTAQIWVTMRDTFSHYSVARVAVTLLRHYIYIGTWLSEHLWMSIASADAIVKRLSFDGTAEALNQDIDDGKLVIIKSSHQANWELYLVAMSILHPNVPVKFSYRPFHNSFAEKYFKHARSRYGGAAVPEKRVLHAVRSMRAAGKGGIFMTLVDQRPRRVQPRHWFKMLDREIAVTGGAYQIARISQGEIYFMSMRRAHLFSPYRVKYAKLASPPHDKQDCLPILSSYIRHAGMEIAHSPHMWMWGISRNKHARNAGEPLVDSSRPGTAK